MSQHAALAVCVSHDDQLLVQALVCVFTRAQNLPWTQSHIYVMSVQAEAGLHVLTDLTDVGFGLLNVVLHGLWGTNTAESWQEVWHEGGREPQKHAGLTWKVSRRLRKRRVLTGRRLWRETMVFISKSNYWEEWDGFWYSPVLGERGATQMGDMALLAVSDREPDGDELIWTGATAPPSKTTREICEMSNNWTCLQSGTNLLTYRRLCKEFVTLKAELKLQLWK